MARKKKHEEHENHERWLVSYADFITLLFAFFVVMYSVSSINEGKYRVLSETMVSAFTNHKPMGKMSVVELPLEQSRPVMEKEIQQKPNDFQVYMKVANALGALDNSNADVSVQNSARGISIKIKDEVAFDSGSVVMKPEILEVLDLIAALVKDLPNLISVEGHTDTIPIRSAQFPSNWELSASRSAALVRFFVNRHHLSSERFSATGYGGERPLESNATPEGRSANRRVDIVILRETTIPQSDRLPSVS